MTEKPRKILVATDFSECSNQALRTAISLGRSLSAELTLFHAYSLPVYMFPDGAVLPGPEMTARMLGQVTEHIEAAKKGLLAEGISVKTETAQGNAVDEIVQAAAVGHYDFLVLGTHGWSGLKHALLGSVAERVVRKAPCPVITVRLQDKPRKHES